MITPKNIFLIFCSIALAFLGVFSFFLSGLAGSPGRLPLQGVFQSGSNADPRAPVGTGFSYQGRLEESGSQANGPFDFRFRL